MVNSRDLDEDDIRSRPPRSSRPRTKDRPDYSKATEAMVVAVDRGRATCVVGEVIVTAMKARELGKKSVVVGDQVRIVGDLTGSDGSLARIVTVLPRTNTLTRTVDNNPSEERMIVANVDQIAIVIAAANPEPRHGFVDRALVVAFDQGIKPLIFLTKRDLADPAEFLVMYQDLDIPVFEIQRGGNLEQVRRVLQGKRTVLLGHSGVGKSTLVNALVESAERLTGSVNDVTGRGRHTSSSAIALKLESIPEDGINPTGWVIDTPGVRSFGLGHIDIQRVIGAFPEFAQALEHCPRNCSHDEETCALNNWEGFDTSAQSRLESLRRLLKS
ncbi:MAG: ribosome small subunit-dependent GTPase A [Actinomycetes bacterium]